MQAEWNPERVLDGLLTEEQVDGDGTSVSGSTEDQARRIFKKHASFAAEAIVWLVKHGDDKMRFDAARYITERVMGNTTSTGFADSVEAKMEKLLEGMKEDMNA